jgi:predicted NBD/HSP70 family sugar kinase
MANANEPLILGVDLGGTRVETSPADAGGGIFASHRRPTDAVARPTLT